MSAHREMSVLVNAVERMFLQVQAESCRYGLAKHLKATNARCEATRSRQPALHTPNRKSG